ncbi:phosphatidylcholine transfer protein-like [Haliotis asinina]|uniref:phosphatidylcholine transfer protein-like n=1 Tax=Haliotis asinina TaxID=109174 RepID=UPI0035319F5B
MFSDEQYNQACKELLSQQVDEKDGWEYFVQSNDVTIYRLINKTSGLYEYKIYGYMKDVQPDICAKVYMDTEYRKKWDSYVNELQIEKTLDHEVIYWNINYPFFMSNRDYVFSRELREIDYENNKMWVVLAKSATSATFPERSGVIRVTDYFQSAALMTDGQSGTKAFMHYYDNPGGMIPTFLINWAAKTGVPQFLTTMQNACRGYEDYLQKASS